MKEIKILEVEGFDVYIDEEDYSYINNFYELKIDTNGYVQCMPKYKRMGLFSTTLHKILMNSHSTGRGVVVDHRDGNKLNNQKINLRICTHQDNMKNRKPHKKIQPNASKYKGVLWIERMKKWRVSIKISKEKRLFVGCFYDEDAAANAYNYYASEYHGEFARLNEVQYMSKEEWEKYLTKTKLTSQYRGVSLIEGRWIAQIYHSGKPYFIGRNYSSEVDAARAYNEKAIELKGEKAILNIL